MKGCNGDHASDMEGSQAHFTPHVKRKNSFKDQKVAEIAISAIFYITFLQRVTRVTIIAKQSILRESTFKEIVFEQGVSFQNPGGCPECDK